MLLINDRGRDAGKFWFTLLHELRHIMQNRVSAVYLSARTAANAEILSLGRNDSEEEADADRFAQETLIPAKEYQAFKDTRPLTVASIKHFAQSIHRSPAIVHGRLQNDCHKISPPVLLLSGSSVMYYCCRHSKNSNRLENYDS